MAEAQKIERFFNALPSNLQAETLDFMEFLMKKHASRPGRKLRQGWAGALAQHKTRYTSLRLQKKALEWRSKSVT